MRRPSSVSTLIFLVIFGLGAGLSISMYGFALPVGALTILAVALAISLLVSHAVNVADQWEKAIVLRLGKFHSLSGPGLFTIIPILDTIPSWIDTRVITASFKAEKTLTKDTVPVDVDAVLFWKVVDAKRAILNVADYKAAIGWASQTALRDVIGKTQLSDILEG
jgi:regulator of protease activity HflC (stomatin/prohibitin superfamily)